MAEIQYTNPQKLLVIQNWPLGGSRRGEAVFQVESMPRGERVLRTTTGKPKASIYFDIVRLFTGSDGKTYYIGMSHNRMLTVMGGDMKFVESIFPQDNRFARIKEMLESGNETHQTPVFPVEEISQA